MSDNAWMVLKPDFILVRSSLVLEDMLLPPVLV